MAYITLAEYKSYIGTLTQGQPVAYSSVDDAALQVFIDEAQAFIENATERRFEASTETRYFTSEAIPFNQPYTLFVGDDLLTVTTLTNGDGNAISDTNYWLYPYNQTPKYAVQLKTTTSWTFSDNGRVSVAGTWGYSATASNNVKGMTKRVAWWVQQKRMALGEVAQFDGGVIQNDGSLPPNVAEWLKRMRRKVTYGTF
jgi:hypothetical protein